MFFNRPRASGAGQHQQSEVDGHQNLQYSMNNEMKYPVSMSDINKYEVPKIKPQNLNNESETYYNRRTEPYQHEKQLNVQVMP